MEALENKPRNREKGESRRDTGKKKVLWLSLGGFSFPGRSKTEKVAVRFILIPWNKKKLEQGPFPFFPRIEEIKKVTFPLLLWWRRRRRRRRQFLLEHSRERRGWFLEQWCREYGSGDPTPGLSVKKVPVSRHFPKNISQN